MMTRLTYRLACLFLPLWMAGSAVMAQPVSDFTSSAESWGTVGKCPSESSPGATWSSTGGNPGGMIYETDEATGIVYWNGSGSEWKADLTSYYGCNFSYDCKTNNLNFPVSEYDILLIRGDDHVLSYNTPYTPELYWTTNAVPLTETGWIYEGLFNSDANCPNLAGTAATAADMLSFLGDIKRIRIRAEFAGLVYETNYLDNVEIVCDPIGLSAQITQFNVYDIGSGRAQIDWVTESETENKFFKIEKSTDGLGFMPIGEVYGQGTSNDPVAYSFTDPDFTKEAYYRLKSYNFENLVQYSDVVVLKRSAPEVSEVRMDPNPASSTATILASVSGEMYSWQIIDLNGRFITGGHIDSDNGWFKHTLDVSDWKSGIYILKVATNQGLKTSMFEVLH